jgi:tetratricopeptide (TPR) repeat protein
MMLCNIFIVVRCDQSMRMTLVVPAIQFVLLFVLGQPLAIWAENISSEWIGLSERWAMIKYRLPQDRQTAAMRQLAEDAKGWAEAHPGEAEPLICQAIVLSTLGSMHHGVDGMQQVKQAKLLLEQAEKIHPKALNGLVYTLLGSLYYRVPGWPVGFGDPSKAKKYLQKALEISPDSVDANYYHGDFLLHNKEYRAAITAFKRALRSPPLVNRPLADAGRREEAVAALAKANQLLAQQVKSASDPMKEKRESGDTYFFDER